MPPRKKTADGGLTAPMRSSGRTRVTQTGAPVPPSPPRPAKSEPTNKRPRANLAEALASEPANKKIKKGIAQEDDGDEAEAEDTQEDVADHAVPEDLNVTEVDGHMVYTDGITVWDALLNQTDISDGANKNKFYVLRLLPSEADKTKCLVLWHWGRVGETGQSTRSGPWLPHEAIQKFKEKFKERTGVEWEARVGMVAKKGKYTWIERDPVVIPRSTLKPEVQELCKFIFSTELIRKYLSSMHYDAEKLPLGTLSLETIQRGLAVLKTLSDVIDEFDGHVANGERFRAACGEYSATYYSIIPHKFGRQPARLIDTQELLRKETDLVYALENMAITSKIISTSTRPDVNGAPVNPLDANFRSLGLTSMEPVSPDTQEYSTLVAYVRDTHGPTHDIEVSVKHAYRLERAVETEAWNNRTSGHDRYGKRLLLWHGSSATNFAGILKEGLRVKVAEAPENGDMFGRGLYFADVVSKSANYCSAKRSNNTGLLLLCDVDVDPFLELTHADVNADQKCMSENKIATKGIGHHQPEGWQDAGLALKNSELLGCNMPTKLKKGRSSDACLQVKFINVTFHGLRNAELIRYQIRTETGAVSPNLYLKYNEYVVYDPSQVRLRYLLMVNVHAKKTV